MRSFILSLFALFLFVSVVEANPRAVAFRNAGIRGPAIRRAANVVNRALFPFAGLRQANFRGAINHGIAFRNSFAFRNHVAFRSHYVQPFAAYSAFSYAPFVQQYVQPVAFAQPAYTQSFAAEVDPCAAYTQSYVQPFAAYQSYGVSPFVAFQSYLRFGHDHYHGGHHGGAIRIR